MKTMSPDTPHLLITHATSSSEECRRQLQDLKLPHLETLVARLTLGDVDDGAADTLTPPHDRALARACGLTAADGCIPWAAWQARETHGVNMDEPCAWITPCHWQLGTSQATLWSPDALQLSATHSQALLAAMQAYFVEDGITLVYDAPTRWLARGELFRGLATASLDRVIGRSIDPWLPQGPAARTMRRLQSEMQMLLYTHAINDERLGANLLPVNSFWVSGAGALADRASGMPAGLRPSYALRDAALQADWPAWQDAWRVLDSGECARLLRELDAGQSVSLTLCGEHQARTWQTRPKHVFRRIIDNFSRHPAHRLLEAL